MPSIIIPVHNRRDVTIGNLSRLRELGIFSRFTVIVVDDGSTDGTSEAITASFSEVVLLHGDGNLFWTGAMEVGMRHAIDQGTDCCVWLNDDLSLSEGAIKQVTELALERQSIVTGQGVIDLENGSQWFFPLLYRAKQGFSTVEADVDCPEPIPVDACRGNLVAIPRHVVARIGYPDGRNIPHVAGDTDYTLRATAAGIPCLTHFHARFYEKETVRDDNRSWLLGTRPLKKIWAESLSRRGNLYPRMLFVYSVRHWGLRGCIRFFMAYFRLSAITLLRLLIPRDLLHRWYAHRSHAYQAYEGRPKQTGNH